MSRLTRPEKYSVVIKCGKGWLKADQLFAIILKGTGLEVADFELVSRLYGRFTWILQDGASKDQVMEEKRASIGKRLTALIKLGAIEYASW